MTIRSDHSVFRYFVVLVVVFFVGFGASSFVHHWLNLRLEKTEELASNERARRLIGDRIVSDIKDLQLDFVALAHANTARGCQVIRDRIRARIEMIQEALRVLESGGHLRRRIPLNLADRDEMLDDVTFVSPIGDDTPMEVIELQPKLTAVEHKADRLTLLVVEGQSEEPTALQSRDIHLFVKQAFPLFDRMTEHANRLFFDSDRRLHQIEQEMDDRRRLFHLVEALLTAAVVAGVLILSIVIGRRVRLILARQREADDEMRASEKKLKDILDTVQTGVVLIDAETLRFVDANPAALQMMAATKEEVLGSGCCDFLCPQERRQCPLVDQGSIQDNSERVLVNSRGEDIPILKSAVFIEIDEKSFILESFFDISERKTMERTIQVAKEEWERTFDALPDLITILDSDHRVVRANRAYTDKVGFGVTEAPGHYCFECVDGTDQPPDYCPHSLTVRDHQPHEVEVHLESLGGEFNVSVTPLFDEQEQFIGSVHVARDITEKKRLEQSRRHLEQQMQHTQKLESLGVLAGGIAHDFNNILMAILGHSDLALHGLPSASPVKPDIEEIQRASKRAADLCRQMLAYSGRGQFVIEAININDLVVEMMGLLRTSVSKKAELSLKLGQELPLIQGDATEIGQVLMNLVINASEALGDDSGVIRIRTGSTDCSREELDGFFWGVTVTEGPFVFLEVEDSGCGMDQDALGKLFEPFFSTKFTGRGLGLSAVSGIIRGHTGAMEVESEIGGGTVFRAFFPVAQGDPEPAELSHSRNEVCLEPTPATVLLVDDEEAVRAVGKSMLEQIGCRVLLATNGREAIEVFRKSADDIDVVILDLTMPEISGTETLEKLLGLRSDVHVIMSSGFAASEMASKLVSRGSAGFLQKPYTIDDLQKKLSLVVGNGFEE